jgi:transposase
MTDQHKYILGIDISKKHFDAALLLPNEKRKNKKFINDQSGFVQLSKWLEKNNVGELHACLEATNIYGHALAEHLFDEGFSVSIVNPARIKGFAQSELLRTKTDKQDASLIARFCQAMKPSLWTPEPKNVRELKALVRRLDAMIEMKQQEVNRLDVAEAIVREDIEGHIELLTANITKLQDTIQKHIDDDPDLRSKKELLLSIPGIGEKTVGVLLSYFATIENFGSAKQLACFCGVTPKVSQSGTSVNRYGRMSKVGPGNLRKALFFPAMVALRYNPPMMLLKERLTAAGKPKMLIIGAAMRKLVHIIYGVLTSKAAFDPNILPKRLVV